MKAKYIIAALFALALGNACVKDEDFDNYTIGLKDPSGGPKGVSFAQATRASINLSIDNVSTSQTLDDLMIALETDQPATQDVTVTLQIDSNIVKAVDTNLTILPEGSYTSTLSVTIPAGQNNVRAPIVIPNATVLDLTKTYGLGYRIVSVSPSDYQIATNLSRLVVSIAIKNEWDGVYLMKGYALRLNDPGLTGNFSGVEMELITAGASAVDFAELAKWGDGQSGIAIGPPRLTIDKSVGNPFPVTISSSGGAYNAPGYSSRYDSTIRTFYISFSWGAGPAARLATDTLEYLRPR